MKMCDECGLFPANVNLTRIQGNESKTSHLCDLCAKKRGIDITVESNGSSDSDPDEGLVCSSCGMRLSEFRGAGRLGCPACYKTFECDIEELFCHIHGARAHKGKTYRRDAEKRAGRIYDSRKLRDELAGAIVNEEFERAALLRDALARVKGKQED